MVGVEPTDFRNGDYVFRSQAAISLNDREYLNGDAIFDAMPVYE